MLHNRLPTSSATAPPRQDKRPADAVAAAFPTSLVPAGRSWLPCAQLRLAVPQRPGGDGRP